MSNKEKIEMLTNQVTELTSTVRELSEFIGFTKGETFEQSYDRVKSEITVKVTVNN